MIFEATSIDGTQFAIDTDKISSIKLCSDRIDLIIDSKMVSLGGGCEFNNTADKQELSAIYKEILDAMKSKQLNLWCTDHEKRISTIRNVLAETIQYTVHQLGTDNVARLIKELERV